jgi:hypothetical protein
LAKGLNSSHKLYECSSHVSELIFPYSGRNKVLKWVKNIRMLSSYHVGSRIWNPNLQFVTLKSFIEILKRAFKPVRAFSIKGKSSYRFVMKIKNLF